MAGEKDRPNYFILLGLDPNASWDEIKFEAALKAKISEWSRQSTSIGPKAIMAQKNREMIPDIRKVMVEDKTLREAEAEGARKERSSTAKDRIVVFEQQLKLAEAKGFLEKGEFDKLVTDFKDSFSEKDIRSRLKVPVRVPAAPDPRGPKKLDPSTVKTIEQLLTLVGASNLYQLLGMTLTTSSAELLRAADQLHREMIARQPKDATVTAKSELAGHAKNIFQSADKRQGYEESLLQQSLNILFKQLDESMNRLSDKTLHARQVQIFLVQAAEKGWRNDEAQEKLVEHARLHKWYVEVLVLEDTLQSQCCGNCQAINEKKRQFCYKCNMPLSIPCPDCGLVVPSNEPGCSRCGFPVGNAFWIDEVLVEYEGLLRRGEMSAADERLGTLERAWTPKKPDARALKIQGYREKIQAFTQKQQQQIEKLRQMVDQRNFYAARQFLTTLSPQTTGDVQSLRQIVDENIARAQSLVEQAQATGINADRKVAFCLQALQLCTDCDEASALLSTLPPASPSNLQAQVNGAVVSLNWTPSSSRSVMYKVIRKKNSRPASMQDGTLIATIAGCIYDDAQPETGIPLFYAVFAAYDKVASARPALLDHPVLLVVDVSQVVAKMDDQQVVLRWRVPDHVHDIIVVRKEGTQPTSAHDGTRLSLADKTSLVDRNVQNGRCYFYGIYCLFQDYDHHLIYSSGVIKDVTPESPPVPITHLDIQSEQRPQGFFVRMSWSAPLKGQVMVLQTSQPPAFKAGETIPASDLSKYGSILLGRGNECEHLLKIPGIVYYSPAVVLQGTAYMGEPQRYVCIEDVTRLEVENLGSTLRLQWTWPVNCQESLVCFDHKQWPFPEKAQTNAVRVSRTEYERHGHYDIRGAASSDYYIVVAAIIRQNSEEIVAAGVRVRARLATKVMLSYEIKQARGFFGPKQTMLHLYANTPSTLPSLLLISKQGRLPIAKTEGTIFFRHPGPFLLENHLIIPLPDMTVPPKTFAKLYLEDDQYCNEVIIHQPGEDKLRLS